MSGDEPDAWQKWVKKNKGRPHSYQEEAYGYSLSDQFVETHRERLDELDADWEIDFTDFLKTLPEMQRLAIEKRLAGIPLNAVERVALSRCREIVAKWLEIRSKELAP